MATHPKPAAAPQESIIVPDSAAAAAMPAELAEFIQVTTGPPTYSPQVQRSSPFWTSTTSPWTTASATSRTHSSYSVPGSPTGNRPPPGSATPFSMDTNQCDHSPGSNTNGCTHSCCGAASKPSHPAMTQPDGPALYEAAAWQVHVPCCQPCIFLNAESTRNGNAGCADCRAVQGRCIGLGMEPAFGTGGRVSRSV
jgi:hypothetical protein